MAYLVCEKCRKYYKLQEGESPDEFLPECECGGKLRYSESLYGKSSDYKKGNESLVNIKNNALSSWNKQSKLSKVIISAVGILIVFSLILGIMGYFHPDTSTSSGYLYYHNVKLEESNKIMEDVGNIIKEYTNNLISEDNAVERLNIDKQKIDEIIQDFESIKIPPQYTKHHELVVSALKDDSNAISELMAAIKNHDSSAVDTVITLMRSSMDKIEQSANEVKRINNIK